MKVIRFIKPGEKYIIQGFETIMGGFYVVDDEGVSNVSEVELSYISDLLIDKKLTIRHNYAYYNDFTSYRSMKTFMRYDLVAWLAGEKSLDAADISIALFYIHGLTVRIFMTEDVEERLQIYRQLLYLLDDDIKGNFFSKEDGRIINDVLQNVIDIITLAFFQEYDVTKDVRLLFEAADDEPDEELIGTVINFLGRRDELDIDELYHLAITTGYIQEYAAERYRNHTADCFRAAAECLDLTKIKTGIYKRPANIDIPYKLGSSHYKYTLQSIIPDGDKMDYGFNLIKIIHSIRDICEYMKSVSDTVYLMQPYKSATECSLLPVTPYSILFHPDTEEMKGNGCYDYVGVWLDLLFRDRKFVIVRFRDFLKAMGYMPQKAASMSWSVFQTFKERLAMYNVSFVPDRTAFYWKNNNLYHKYDDICVLWKNKYSFHELKNDIEIFLFDFVIRVGKIIRANGSDKKDIQLVTDFLNEKIQDGDGKDELLAYLYWMTSYNGKRPAKWDNPDFRKESFEIIKEEIKMFDKKVEWFGRIKQFRHMLFNEEKNQVPWLDQIESWDL